MKRKHEKRLKDAKFERREIINSVSHEGGRRLWRFSSEHNRQQCDDRLGKNLRSKEIYVTFPLFLTLFHAPYFPVSTDPTPFAYYPYLPVIKNNTKKFEKKPAFPQRPPLENRTSQLVKKKTVTLVRKKDLGRGSTEYHSRH